ncbi:tetratricopeptide repeat protein [Aequorivita xiaoshiensis]|uniref:Tetratricopeptide repeat protein n=1 Tax=Aequorivita xiaoshiensis TaxID=2874476 RepID=A0A9X1UBG0_9FLAO|nr:tetratricopeptide repeat protein [Aequorivita xiaoshiensis]MCG2429541.1 tetratricopeptide repeat protein [Aequorivita xiaoshiensis]
MNLNDFFNELKRRNVFKGTVSYLIFSWVLLQVISILGPIINAPIWFGKMILIILIVLLPVWICISWFFEITTDGIKKTKNVPKEKSITQKTGQKLNTFIIAFLAIAIILLFVDRFRLRSENKENAIALETKADKSIAVLPFSDMSPNQQQEYFADGLAEEVLNSLAKINELQVTSRTSAFSFKNKNIDLQEIARTLNVSYILEGSVRTQDSIIRVNVNLVETDGDNNIWSQTWEKELTNIFQIQNEIAEAVAENLQLRILDNIIPSVTESNTDAYALFLEGRYIYQNNYNVESLLKSERLLKQSLAIDSTYAAALITLGNIYHSQNNYGIIDYETGKKLTYDVAEKAIKADSTYAEIYAFMSLLSLEYENDIGKAGKLAQKALQLDPNNETALHRASEVALLRGNTEEAIAIHKRVIKIDPVNASNYYSLANTYYMANNFKEAEKHIEESIRLNPNQDVAYSLYALILINQEKYNQALEVIKKEPLVGFRLHTEAIIYHFLGDHEKTETAIMKLIADHEKSWSYQIAATYAVLEKEDKMYYWLEKAHANKDLGLIELPNEPMFEAYRNQARFKDFIKKLGYKY